MTFEEVVERDRRKAIEAEARQLIRCHGPYMAEHFVAGLRDSGRLPWATAIDLRNEIISQRRSR